MTRHSGTKKSGAKPKPPVAAKPSHHLSVPDQPGKSRAELLAEASLSPLIRNASIARAFTDDLFAGDPTSVEHAVAIIARKCAEVRAGNFDDLTDVLTAQIATLDSLFTSCVQRAAKNIGHHPEAVDRYMGLALKAQANCRITAETIARMKRDGRQTVKVIHVHEGGQAVVADTINQGAKRRGASAENDRQVHEQTADAVIAALPGPDPARDGVPLPSFERKETMQASRGQIDGCAQGQSQRLEARRPLAVGDGGELVSDGDGAPHPQD